MMGYDLFGQSFWESYPQLLKDAPPTHSACPMASHVSDIDKDQADGGLIAGEDAAVTCVLAHAAVEKLNDLGGVDKGSQFLGY
jgi:hypothetical protein